MTKLAAFAKNSPFLIGGLLPDKGDIHTGDKLEIVGTTTTQSFGATVLQAFVKLNGKQLAKPLKLTGGSCEALQQRGFENAEDLAGVVCTVECKQTPKGVTITVVDAVKP